MMGKYVFCVEKEVRVAMHKVHIRLHNSSCTHCPISLTTTNNDDSTAESKG